jgi:hypothetical protein
MHPSCENAEKNKNKKEAVRYKVSSVGYGLLKL